MLKAQPVNNLVKDVTMPAPNAASLGKYGDYSVGNFTGVPDISIPIYTVQEGSLSLPIGLSYHASGIKVAEMASWVGAGWSCNAGGIITRTVQGIADDNDMGYFNQATYLETQINQASGNSALNAQISYDISNGYIDGEPDIFSFNVGGYTGKFYIDKNHNAQFIPKQDLKLEIDDVLKGFTLIAPNGTRYIFGRVLNADGVNYTTAWEKTLMQGQTGGQQYISSWYLVRVETPDKKYKINLFYDDEGYSYLNNASVKFNSYQGPASSSDYQFSSSSGIDAYHTTLRSYISGKKLIQITSSTDVIDFVSNTIRDDLDDDKGYTPYWNKRAKSLDKIEIKSGDRCQKFDFSYTYFQDAANPIPANPSVAKKLKLESVTQKSCDGTIVNPAYTFTYDGNFISYRLSKAIDHWGFYNGATQNETNILNIPPTIGDNNLSMGSSNRETNETEMKKGVLTDITFPTGGKTTFTYEANTIPTSQQSAPVPVFNLGNCSSPFNTACCDWTYTGGYYSITAEDVNTGKFKLQLVKPMGGGYPPTDLCYNNYNISNYIYVYDATTWAYIGSYGFSLNSGQANYSVELPLNTLGSLQAGKNYYFELDVNSGYSTFQIYNQPWVAINKKIGGLRVKEIKTNDGISSANDIVKQYDYSLPNNAGTSSGMPLRFPKYHFSIGFPVNSAAYCVMGAGNMSSFNDESIVPLYTFEGNHIGYNYVKETQNGNGTKLYNFYVATPTSSSYTFPLPPQDPLVFNGQIKGLKIISQTGTILKETTNQQNYENYTLSIGKIRKAYQISLPPSSSMPECGALSAIAYTDYQIRTLPYRLSSTTETLDGVSTTSNYTYSTDATQPLFPLTTSMTNSDGKTTVTTNKYITHTDYNADPIATKLKQLNIIADPIEATTTVAGVQINGARTQYSFFDNTSGLPTTSATNSFPYPNQFYKYKMTWDANGNAQVFGINSGWELEGTITKFDMTRGKPLSINLRAWENATETDATEKYTWETNGLIKTRTFKGFVWQYEYSPNTRLVSKIIDKDGQFVTYTYDHLQRLTTASARNGAVSTSYTYTYKDPTQSNKSWIETKTTFTSVIGGTLSNNTTYKTIRQYMDGLGRPIQSVAVANSPNLKDVISTVAYDNQGRESLKYDPFESVNATGAFVSAVPTGQPFTKLEYEASPLSRTSIVTPPGWLPTTTTYGTNASNEAYDNTGAAFFPANTLNRTITTDPDGRVMKTYTDKKGRKVFTVKVQNNAAGGHYMIYSFDDKDRLNKVYTPRNAWQEWYYAPNLDYSYRYDLNDNMIWKQLPDIAAINIQYNARNQMVLMQDGKQAGLGQWLATQYDDYGRPSATGFATSTALNATTFNPTLSSTLTTTDYSTVAGTELGKPIRTKNYLGTYLESFMQYDAYGRLSNALSNNQLYSPGGAITATNFSEKITMVYDLADNILTRTRTHKPNASTSRTIVETNDYDNGLRLKQMKHQLDAMPVEILSYNDYNVKNQVQTKWMGKSGALNFLQKVDYNYNSLGWLTGINQNLANGGLDRPLANCYYPANVATSTTDLDINDLFSLELKYENPNAAYAPSGTTVTPQYGGNISQVVWKVKGREKQAYTLKYDSENRMTEAMYSDIGNSGTITGNRYDEKLTYDIRGNINTLQRWGLNGSCTWGLIDNLTYNYGASGYNPKNQLQSVTESSDLTKGFKSVANGSTYTYDTNGNLTADPNKSITNIVYNHLNLPMTITFINNRTISFLYDAGGNKLRKTVVDNGIMQYIQDYVGGIEYRTNSSNVIALEAIYHAEGRITTISGTLKYEYAMKDHLGNTRLMFCDKNSNGVITQSGAPESSEVTQENHYYSFGMAMENVWYNTPSVTDNKYQYNGKEYNDDFGLNMNDYGARFYDPAIGKWNGFDPMAEAYQSMSPYHYAMNNPMRFIDPNGMYSNDGTTSRNTSALDTDGGMVGGTIAPNGKNVAILISNDKTANAKTAKKQGTWDVIAVTSLAEAAEQLSKYKDSSIDNILLSTHGGFETNANTDEIHDRVIKTADGVLLKGLDAQNKIDANITTQDMSSLKTITSKIITGGNLIMNSCTYGGNNTSLDVIKVFLTAIYEISGCNREINICTPTNGSCNLYEKGIDPLTKKATSVYGLFLPKKLLDEANPWLMYNGTNFTLIKYIAITQTKDTKPIEIKRFK